MLEKPLADTDATAAFHPKSAPPAPKKASFRVKLKPFLPSRWKNEREKLCLPTESITWMLPFAPTQCLEE